MRRTENSVLLVDDDSMVCAVAKRMLELGGYSVVAAESGHEALDAARSATFPFSAAVIDIALPDISGLEVFAELRRSNPNIPVVVISGYGPNVAPELAGETRVARVSKPFRPDELLGALDAASASV